MTSVSGAWEESVLAVTTEVAADVHALGEFVGGSVAVVETAQRGEVLDAHHVGLAACMARVHQTAKSPPVKIGAILMFCVGALIIGLVLLDHEHCVAEDDDSHAGHDHGR